MEINSTELEGVKIIEPRIFADDRGWFAEIFNQLEFAANDLESNFVQDNLSCSSKNVLRGLHFQDPPHAQGKFVRVVHGSVIDVVVDIRSSSPTYGKHIKVLLSATNKRALWIPRGFAHGFLSLEDDTLFLYKCTNYYNSASENTLLWNDPDLAIDWDVESPVVSAKDKQGKAFGEFKSLF